MVGMVYRHDLDLIAAIRKLPKHELHNYCKQQSSESLKDYPDYMHDRQKRSSMLSIRDPKIRHAVSKLKDIHVYILLSTCKYQRTLTNPLMLAPNSRPIDKPVIEAKTVVRTYNENRYISKGCSVIKYKMGAQIMHITQIMGNWDVTRAIK